MWDYNHDINLKIIILFQQSDLGISGGRFTTAMLYLSTVEVCQIKNKDKLMRKINKTWQTNLYTQIQCSIAMQLWFVKTFKCENRSVLYCLNTNKNAKTNIDTKYLWNSTTNTELKN